MENNIDSNCWARLNEEKQNPPTAGKSKNLQFRHLQRNNYIMLYIHTNLIATIRLSFGCKMCVLVVSMHVSS